MITKRPGAKRTVTHIHSKFYKKAFTAVEAFRSETANGDKKLFRQLWRLEQRLKNAWTLDHGATFKISLTEIQYNLMKYAMRR